MSAITIVDTPTLTSDNITITRHTMLKYTDMPKPTDTIMIINEIRVSTIPTISDNISLVISLTRVDLPVISDSDGIRYTNLSFTDVLEVTYDGSTNIIPVEDIPQPPNRSRGSSGGGGGGPNTPQQICGTVLCDESSNGSQRPFITTTGQGNGSNTLPIWA